MINKKLGIEPDKVADNLQAVVGDTGTAQPLMMLASALEDAKPGDKILLVSYGSGCDALCFEVTENINEARAPARDIRLPGAQGGPRQLREVPDLAAHGAGRYRPARRGGEVDPLVADVEVAPRDARPGGLEVQGLRTRSSSRRRGYASTRPAGSWTRWSRSCSPTRAARGQLHVGHAVGVDQPARRLRLGQLQRRRALRVRFHRLHRGRPARWAVPWTSASASSTTTRRGTSPTTSGRPYQQRRGRNRWQKESETR